MNLAINNYVCSIEPIVEIMSYYKHGGALIKCPYCNCYHLHGTLEGSRVPHCNSSENPDYILKYTKNSKCIKTRQDWRKELDRVGKLETQISKDLRRKENEDYQKRLLVFEKNLLEIRIDNLKNYINKCKKTSKNPTYYGYKKHTRYKLINFEGTLYTSNLFLDRHFIFFSSVLMGGNDIDTAWYLKSFNNHKRKWYQFIL
jgi:hypothetical protein